MKTLSIASVALFVCAFAVPASADPLAATKASVAAATKVTTAKPGTVPGREAAAPDAPSAKVAQERAALEAEAAKDKGQSDATLNQLFDDGEELLHMLVSARRAGDADAIQCVSRALNEVHSAERIATEQRQVLLDAWQRNDVGSARFAFELVSRERGRGTEKRAMATACVGHKRYVPDTSELRVVADPSAAKATSAK